MKKTLIALGGGVALLVIAVLVGPSLIDWNTYKGEITSAVETAIGRRLSIDGDLTFTVLPSPALSASGVRLANVEGAATPDFLTIKDVRIRVSISDLLQGRIAVEQVRLIEPVIALEVLPDGRTSWDIAPRSTSDARQSGSTPQESADSGVEISLESLTITDGTLSYRDGARVERVDKFNAEISAKSLQGPFTVSASALFQGLLAKVTLRVGAVRAGESIGLAATVDLEGVNTRLSFDGTLKDPGPAVVLAGKLRVEGDDAALTARDLLGVDPPRILARAFSIGGALSASATALEINNVEARLGSAVVTGAVNVALGEILNVDIALAMTKLDLDEYASTGNQSVRRIPAATTTTATTTARGAAKGSSPQASALTLPTNLNASLDMSVDVVRYNGGVVRKVGLRAVLSNGAITLDRASALFPGGSDVSMFGFMHIVDGAPHFEGEVAVTSDNLRAALDWLSIDTGEVSKDHLRGFSYASKVKATLEDVEVTDINIRLDASTMTGAMALALRERPGIGLRLAIDRINLDNYLGEGFDAKRRKASKVGTAAASKGKKTPISTGVSVLDTFDANFDFRVDRLTVLGATIRNLKTDGSLVGGDLSLRHFSVADAVGVAAELSGEVRGLGATPTYSMNFDIAGKDTARMFRWLGAKPPVSPKALGRITLKGVAKGGREGLDLTAKIGVAGAKVTVEGAVQGLSGAPSVDFHMRIDHPDLTRAVRLFAPDFKPAASKLGPLSVAFRMLGSANNVDISQIDATLGPVAVKGTVAAKLGGSRPVIQAKLAMGEILADLFLPAKAPQNTARSRRRRANGLSLVRAQTGGRPTPVNQRWSREKIDLSGLQLVDADVELTMAGLILEQFQLNKPRLKFKLENGILNIREFKGGFLGGAFTSAGIIDASGKTPKISAALNIQNIDSARILEIIEMPARLSGPVSLEFSGGATGDSEAALIAGLNGEGRLEGQIQIKVSKSERSAAGVLNLASALFGKKVKELGQVGDVSGALLGAFGQNPAELTGDLLLRKGLLSTKNGRLAGAGAQALITGVVDLPQWLIESRASMFQNGENAPLVEVVMSGALDSPNIKLGGDILKRRTSPSQQDDSLRRLLPGLLGGGSTEKPKARDLIKGLLKGLGG